jgi:hypothetical protein
VTPSPPEPGGHQTDLWRAKGLMAQGTIGLPLTTIPAAMQWVSRSSQPNARIWSTSIWECIWGTGLAGPRSRCADPLESGNCDS